MNAQRLSLLEIVRRWSPADFRTFLDAFGPRTKVIADRIIHNRWLSEPQSSLESIGLACGVTRERARQVEGMMFNRVHILT